MKIAIISSLFPPFGVGGAEQVVSQMALALHRLGQQVDVISTCSRRALNGDRYRTDEWEGLRVWRIAPLNLYWRFDRETALPNRLARAAWHAVDLWNPSIVAPLNQILRRIQPEVINTHNIDGLSPLVWKIARKHAGGVVHTLHDCHLLCPSATMQHRNGTMCRRVGFCRGYSLYHRLFQDSVSVLAAPAMAIADLHRQSGWTGPRIEIIRNAVDIPPLELPDIPAHGPLQVLFLSRLEREKGCETVMAVVRSFQGVNDIEFHLAGRGTYEKQMSELAQTGRNVVWHGYVSGNAKRDLLSRADVFLQLSECLENAPLGLIEARRYGLYLVGTNVGGIPEEINSPEVGQLIPPREAEKLSRTLRFLAGRRDALRRARLLRLPHTRYGTREMAEEYLRVFRSLVEPPL
ncbi:MAG TPA: glycosyltransferase [Bryobacteraceae bacterium]|nr:glycosyltransferase [Bryobacteraceae bacterium]